MGIRDLLTAFILFGLLFLGTSCEDETENLQFDNDPSQQQTSTIGADKEMTDRD